MSLLRKPKWQIECWFCNAPAGSQLSKYGAIKVSAPMSAGICLKCAKEKNLIE
jgi:hypothetical protein